jgi:hypothetical protein
MSKVVAYKEPSWMDGKTDFRLWANITRAYGVELELLEPKAPLEFIEGTVVVVMDERGTQTIEKFDHPDECVYVFGRTHMNELMDTPHDHSVRIEYEGQCCLFGIQAASIMLEDRRQKL